MSAWPMGLRMTCSAAPLQIEGPIDGGYVYFRMRHGWWQLAIGRTPDEAVEATITCAGAPICFSDEQESDDPADRDEARAILNEYLPKLRLR